MAVETIGIPTVTFVCEGFRENAKKVMENSGFPPLRLAVFPGHIDMYNDTDKREKLLIDVLPQVINLLTQPFTGKAEAQVEPGPREIVFKGTFEEVNEYFYNNHWTDGLPIVPPTLQKVEEFLKYTDRSPTEVLGVFMPSKRQATVWDVAINGVMAGCRPEYMPILIAVVETIADPNYKHQNSGSTPGWEGQIILNGPLAKQLDFNCKGGVMRPGVKANTSVGRFYRLFIRNLPRFLPGTTDQGTFGQSFRVVVAENEEFCAEIGWNPLHVVRGFKKADNVVTIMSVVNQMTHLTQGDKAEKHLYWIGHYLTRENFPYRTLEKQTPLVFLSPVIAKVLAQGGYSKEKARDALWNFARMPAKDFDKWLLENQEKSKTTEPTYYSACEAVKGGKLPKYFCESNDPNRLIPILQGPEEIQIVVTGDPGRNRSMVTRQNASQGYGTSKLIQLPANWDKLMADLGYGPLEKR